MKEIPQHLQRHGHIWLTSEQLQKAKGIEEQAAIIMIIGLRNEGLDPEILGEYMAGVADGKATQVLETLGREYPKLVSPQEINVVEQKSSVQK